MKTEIPREPTSWAEVCENDKQSRAKSQTRQRSLRKFFSVPALCHRGYVDAKITKQSTKSLPQRTLTHRFFLAQLLSSFYS